MGFFARPNLDDIQFKQLSGSTLTMSGQTRIATTGNLSFQSGNTFIPIIITGGTNLDVLTLVSGKIRLQSPSSGASTGYYTCKTPSTICVGGIPANTVLTGKTIACLFEEMLVPTVSPTITPPSESSFTINPSASIYEVGTVINVCAISCFSRGCICPQYCGTCCFRSGVPYSYNNIDFGVIQAPFLSSACCHSHSLAAHCVTKGNNTLSATISYCSGATSARNSNGSVFAAALPAGTTAALSCIICGLYPYFYGKIASGNCPAGVNRPAINTICNCMAAKCGCCVGDSNGSLYFNFNSSLDDYLWFAVPSGSTIKTSWSLTPSNNGVISGATTAGGNLFPNSVTVPITCVLWNNVGGSPYTYRVYISNYQSAVNTVMTVS